MVVAVGLTVIDGPVCPLLHATVPLQPEAVSWVLSPVHKLASVELMVGVPGKGSTFTVASLLNSLLHPWVDVQVALYAASTTGLTTSELAVVCVVPSLQITVPVHPEAVRVTDVFKQILELAGVIVGGAGFVLTVKFTALLTSLSQPVGSKQVAV